MTGRAIVVLGLSTGGLGLIDLVHPLQPFYLQKQKYILFTIMSILTSSQANFHRTSPAFAQNRRSLDMIVNRPSFTAHHSPIELEAGGLRRLDGSEIKRMQAQAQIKRRYQRMIELQHLNFIERHDLEAERQNKQKNEQEKVHSKTRELRQEMVQTGQAARQWQHRNRCEGAELRHQRVINHRFRIERDNSELQRKKEVVSHHQRSFRMKPRPKRGLLGEGERLSQVNWSEL